MRTSTLQKSLFENIDYFSHKFPQPQYLGAKHLLGSWITQFIPSEANTVLDAFSGSQSIAFLCKQLGFSVITNDFLKFNSEIGKALIENKNIYLTSDDLEQLFSANTNPTEYNLIESIYTNVFFTREDAKFLDNYRSNITQLDNEYKKALAIVIANRAMTRKVTMGHFAHTQALNYAANPDRIKRNRSLIRPVKSLISDLLDDYNNAVFDNEKDCKAYNENILDLLPELKGIDVVYFDPPYCNSHADYQAFYHLLETFTMYWKHKEFINGTKRYSPKKYSGFDLKKDVIKNFQLLFEMSKDIPLWLISYNNRSYPDIQTLVSLIKPYRKVLVHEKPYLNSRGGKGSVAGSNEILLECKSFGI